MASKRKPVLHIPVRVGIGRVNEFKKWRKWMNSSSDWMKVRRAAFSFSDWVFFRCTDGPDSGIVTLKEFHWTRCQDTMPYWGYVHCISEELWIELDQDLVSHLTNLFHSRAIKKTKNKPGNPNKFPIHTRAFIGWFAITTIPKHPKLRDHINKLGQLYHFLCGHVATLCSQHLRQKKPNDRSLRKKAWFCLYFWLLSQTLWQTIVHW